MLRLKNGICIAVNPQHHPWHRMMLMAEIFCCPDVMRDSIVMNDYFGEVWF